MAKNKGLLWICLVLMVTTIGVYWRVHSYDFVSFDDKVYVTENIHFQDGLTTKSVAWAFTSGYAANWHPLTWISLLIDYEIYGTDNPGGFHITNLLLHTAASVLLLLVLYQMTGRLWPSAFVAFLFALHPLHVESVAWISERKDVLSTLFWVLTVAAYARFVQRGGLSNYLLAIVVFTLGLMSKPMLVTLPFVLLLLDYWPLNRFDLTENIQQPRQKKNAFTALKLITEKIPFFLLAAVSSGVTYFVQQHGGATIDEKTNMLKLQIPNAIISYTGYISKMFYPAKLAAFYPHPKYSTPTWHVAASLVILIVITVVAIYFARKHRYLIVGWLWYLGTLVPVIGLVQVGTQGMADRYTYVPLIGLFVMIAWTLADVVRRWERLKPIVASLSVAVILALSVCTFVQLDSWRNSKALYKRMIDVTTDNYIAYLNLGILLSEDNNTLPQAIELYKKAIQIRHYDVKALNNLGAAFARQNNYPEAIKYYKEKGLI